MFNRFPNLRSEGILKHVLRGPLRFVRKFEMSTESSSHEILDREFLPIRAKILEIAASLDRIQRASGNVAEDPRLLQLHTAISKLLADDPDRAKQIQLLFSRPYQQQWRDALNLAR